MEKVNVAEAYDLQDRLNDADRELSIVHNKLRHEARKNQRLRQQNYENIEAHKQAIENCKMMSYHFQLVSSSHFAITQEFEKAKLMVKTLEAVIRMLYISSGENSGSMGTMGSEKQPEADKKD